MATKPRRKKTNRPSVCDELAAEKSKPLGPTKARSWRGEDIDELDFSGIRVSRLRGGVKALYESGKLTQKAMDAADRWRRDFEFGVHGASAPEKSSSGPDSCYQSARLNALTRWRKASEAVGEVGVQLLRIFAYECLSIRSASRIIEASRLGIPHAWDGRELVERERKCPITGRIIKEMVAEGDPIFHGLPSDRDKLTADLIRVCEALAEHYEMEEKIRRLMSRMRKEIRVAA